MEGKRKFHGAATGLAGDGRGTTPRISLFRTSRSRTRGEGFGGKEVKGVSGKKKRRGHHSEKDQTLLLLEIEKTHYVP